MKEIFSIPTNKPVYLFMQNDELEGNGGIVDFIDLVEYAKKENLSMALFKSFAFKKDNTKTYIYTLHTNIFDAQLIFAFDTSKGITDIDVDNDIKGFTTIHKPLLASRYFTFGKNPRIII